MEIRAPYEPWQCALCGSVTVSPPGAPHHPPDLGGKCRETKRRAIKPKDNQPQIRKAA